MSGLYSKNQPRLGTAAQEMSGPVNSINCAGPNMAAGGILTGVGVASIKEREQLDLVSVYLSFPFLRRLLGLSHAHGLSLTLS